MIKKIGVKAVALGTLAAAGAGYLTGILTAPKSGKETRKDISSKAIKVRRDGEKQLKKLHSDLTGLIKEGETRTKKAGSKANKQLQDALDKAKTAKNKSREMLSAVRNGDAEDPNLQAVVEEVKLAKTNLLKYLKK